MNTISRTVPADIPDVFELLILFLDWIYWLLVILEPRWLDEHSAFAKCRQPGESIW
jgi:hypothetical protein